MSTPVVVGVDGGTPSLEAASWGAHAAVSRKVPLLLVFVVEPAGHDASTAEMAHARQALHRAWQCIRATGEEPLVQTDVRVGEPAAELASAARGAALLCLGAASGKKHSRSGALARTLTRHAHTPVALIRRQSDARRSDGTAIVKWIVAILDESHGAEAALRAALDEARSRNAPVLALTSWSTTLRGVGDDNGAGVRQEVQRHLDSSEDSIDLCALPLPADPVRLLEDAGNTVQMVVVAGADAADLHTLTSRRAERVLRQRGCTVLVV
jgi:nucleotide-binding universal stress UspA family protein